MHKGKRSSLYKRTSGRFHSNNSTATGTRHTEYFTRRPPQCCRHQGHTRLANCVFVHETTSVPMANQGRRQAAAEPGRAAVVVPGRRRAPAPVLAIARLLMLCGALAAVEAMGSQPIDAREAILSLGLWLLGVSLLAFVPILRAGRFRPPRPALVVAALANAVLRVIFFLLYIPRMV